MAAAPATAPARALVSSSSSSSRGVNFFSGTSRPNLVAAAASASAPGWRRRDPAVSVAAGSAQSALGALAVDPKVCNSFSRFMLLFFLPGGEISWGLGADCKYRRCNRCKPLYAFVIYLNNLLEPEAHIYSPELLIYPTLCISSSFVNW
jgi:hypothetical protein